MKFILDLVNHENDLVNNCLYTCIVLQQHDTTVDIFDGRERPWTL